MSVDTSVDKGNHFVNSHGRVLLLLEEFGQLSDINGLASICESRVCDVGVQAYTFTTVESLLSGSIQIGTELGESSDLTVLGQEKLQGTSDLLHSLKLSSGTDTGYRETDVDGRSNTLVEEFGFQEDLSVSNGDNVSWDVSGHITTLGLNDGQSCERSTTVLVAHLGSTLEKTRVEVEN